MAEPSLLCVSCGLAPPPHRRTWGRCTICVECNLPSTYYCGEECMNAHWQNGHKEYHKQQRRRLEEFREGTALERESSLAESEARHAERTGNEYDKRFADGLALMAECDYHAAAKAWRKLIKECPDEPTPYHNLAVVLDSTGHYTQAAPMYLKAMELFEGGTEHWAVAAAGAFESLQRPESNELPKPEWWNDEDLKALSARVVAIVPNDASSRTTRGFVLVGGAVFVPSWNPGPRTAVEIKEAATWFRRAARVGYSQADRRRNEERASLCDAVADPMLAKEEAEAAKARAAAEVEAAKARVAAEAEAAEALKVAEAKALAAAEELLADEETEKQQAAKASSKAGKTKQGKAKKGKGKR